MKNPLWLVVLFALGLGLVDASGEEISVQSTASTETRGDHPWTKLSAVVEASTDLPVGVVLSVVTDWASYPRLFSKVKRASTSLDGTDVLLSETTEVSVLGFSVTNRFTLRVKTAVDSTSGVVSIRWTQEASDGTIQGIEGGWDLVPGADGRKTLVRYRSLSSVPQSFFGEDGVLSLFLPGEMKQVMAQVLAEARQKKETP